MGWFENIIVNRLMQRGFTQAEAADMAKQPWVQSIASDIAKGNEVPKEFKNFGPKDLQRYRDNSTRAQVSLPDFLRSEMGGKYAAPFKGETAYRANEGIRGVRQELLQNPIAAAAQQPPPAATGSGFMAPKTSTFPVPEAPSAPGTVNEGDPLSWVTAPGRQPYSLTTRDRGDIVRNIIAGEINAGDRVGAEAVVSNMLNRVGGEGFLGSTGSIHDVATAGRRGDLRGSYVRNPGSAQYTGWRVPGPQEAAMIDQVLAGVASGEIADPTGGSTGYLSAPTVGRRSWLHGNTTATVGGNRFGVMPGTEVGPYAGSLQLGKPEMMTAMSSPAPGAFYSETASAPSEIKPVSPSVAARGSLPATHPATGRPLLPVPGGFATEESITVTDPRINGGRPTNIPSIWGGQRAPSSDPRSVEAFAVQEAIKSGQTFPSYSSIPAAETAAQARSAMLGQTVNSIPVTPLPPSDTWRSQPPSQTLRSLPPSTTLAAGGVSSAARSALPSTLPPALAPFASRSVPQTMSRMPTMSAMPPPSSVAQPAGAQSWSSPYGSSFMTPYRRTPSAPPPSVLSGISAMANRAATLRPASAPTPIQPPTIATPTIARPPTAARPATPASPFYGGAGAGGGQGVTGGWSRFSGNASPASQMMDIAASHRRAAAAFHANQVRVEQGLRINRAVGQARAQRGFPGPGILPSSYGPYGYL